MIYLDYTDLSQEAQNRLLQNSRKDVQRKFGEDIRRYAQTHQKSFDSLLEEEAQRNLYTYNYQFRI